MPILDNLGMPVCRPLGSVR
uniref:Uncharacterized protein n=1 Tax=Anguilla anguilla TaxID=7936 RepID=A0A0E9PFF0_ANGAN